MALAPGGDPRKLGVLEAPPSDDDADDDGCCTCCPKDETKTKGPYVDADEPGHVPPKCTDLICLVVFIAALAGLGWIGHYSRVNGDIERLYHGYNFLGELCGMEGPWDSEGANKTRIYDHTDKSKLFWCEKACTPSASDPKCRAANNSKLGGFKLDLDHPVCRETCPTSSATDYACYDGMAPGARIPIADAGPGTFKKTNTYLFRQQADYASKVFMLAYCVPEEQALFDDVMEFIREQPAMEMVIEAGNLIHAWPLLLGTAALAIVLGFVYLFVLEKLACCLVYSSMVILDICPLVAGGFLIYAYTQDGVDWIPGTGYAHWDLVIGIACLVLGLVFVLMSFCLGAAIETAIRVVQATSSCLMDMPSLLWEPVITQIFRLLVLLGLLFGFFWLLSCGEISTMSLEMYALSETGVGINGIFRTFTYTEEEWYLILYYVFLIFWIMCLCTAMSQFAIAHAVQYWYFTPYDPNSRQKEDLACCPIIRGYGIGLFYHLGSMAFGSFIIATLMFIRMILSFIAHQAKQQENAAVQVAAQCMGCCLACFQRCMEFLNKNAYMDIALNHTSFCFAARNAVSIIMKQFAQIAILNGACWVFEWAGVGAITAGGVALVWVSVDNISTFNDMGSDWYIADRLAIMIVAGLICFMISYAFMSVYDMVADTILYCKATEEIRRRRPPGQGGLNPNTQFAPRKLDALIRGDDHGSDGSSSE